MELSKQIIDWVEKNLTNTQSEKGLVFTDGRKKFFRELVFG